MRGVAVANRPAKPPSKHRRQRAERAQQDAAGAVVLPAEAEDVVQVSAVEVLDAVAESGPNYSLLPAKENSNKQ